MSRTVISSVTGQVLKRLVAKGDSITEDTEVAMLEAMKMHIPVMAEQEGRVARWLVEEGAAVQEGQPLLALED